MKIPKQVYTFKSIVIFVFVLALYVMLFAVLYAPTFGFSPEEVSMWAENASFCIPIICAIVAGVTAISRLLLWLLSRNSRLNEMEYLYWQVGEIIVMGLFLSLFLSLYFHMSYFALLTRTLLMEIAVLIYPYAIYWLYLERCERDNRINEAQQTIMRLRKGNEVNEDEMMRFIDDKGTVRLIVAADKVYTIEAAGNYVNILYDNGTKLLRFSLRNTLKGVEELCETNNIVRCHRSYFVNLRKVKVLRKDGDGVFAEMAAEGVDDMPVSKNYASEVMERFAMLNAKE